jgi:hypothetical protein
MRTISQYISSYPTRRACIKLSTCRSSVKWLSAGHPKQLYTNTPSSFAMQPAALSGMKCGMGDDAALWDIFVAV